MPLLRAFFLIVVIFAAYAPMLSSPFKTMDDQFSIVSNQAIKDPAQWGKLFKQGYFNDHSYYRPLVNLSFMLEYSCHKLDPFFYNMDNLLIHIANALLVWLLVGILVNFEVGFWAALFFGVHPIQWEAVCNISGRAILLSVFFGLISFIAHLKERRILALFAFIAALLCKESAAMLLPVLFVHAWLYRKDMRWIWSWGAVAVAYVCLRKYLGITETFPWRNAHDHTLGILTFLRSVVTDLRLFIYPVDLHFDRSMPLFTGIFERGAMLTVFISLVAVSWLGIARKGLSTLHWLALAWFALSLLPVSQIVTTIGVQPGSISTAEHFLYAASVPVFMLLADAGLKFVQYAQGRQVLARVLYGSIIALFFLSLFFTSVGQSTIARSEEWMMARSLAIQPQNARLQSSLGMIYALRGEYAPAEQRFRNAVAGDPQNARYRISLAQSLCDQGRCAEALGQFILIQDPGTLKDLWMRNTEKAFLHVQADIKAGRELGPQDWSAVGVYHAKMGNMDEAAAAFGRVLAIKPEDADAIFNLASIYEARGETEHALAHYNELLALPSPKLGKALLGHAKDYVEIHTK